MERLTKQWGKDNCNCVPVYFNYELLDMNYRNFKELEKIMRKLADYEDTGLLPEDIVELTDLLEKLTNQNLDLKWKLAERMAIKEEDK